MSTHHPILISGAGIGGLCAALALIKTGHEVQIFERAEALRAQGAGIIIQPNAMLVMRWLGLEERIRERGHLFDQFGIFNAHGQVIQRSTTLPKTVERQAPQGVAIHRTSLMELLAQALPQGTIHFNAATKEVEQDERGVTLITEDLARHRGSALIGCDGLHSKVRESLHGPAPLRDAGYITLRGLSPVSVPAHSIGEYWGAQARFGIVPLGPALTYWYTAIDRELVGDDALESLERFRGWTPTIDELIKATPADQIITTESLDRPIAKRWGRDKITLLGDAAHPMTPNLGQGACQAIEDAFILARSLKLPQEEAPSLGLARYEAARLRRANMFVTRSWRIGAVAHWRSAWMRQLRDAMMRAIPESFNERAISSLYLWPPLLQA